MEAVTRSDMDDYKTIRSRELFGDRPVSPATINFEITILRALFYYVIRERGVSMDNPCARFKPLRSEKERLKGRPPVYGQAEIDKIFAECNDTDRAIFATLVLTGQRKDELVNLTWDDVDLNGAVWLDRPRRAIFRSVQPVAVTGDWNLRRTFPCPERGSAKDTK